MMENKEAESLNKSYFCIHWVKLENMQKYGFAYKKSEKL